MRLFVMARHGESTFNVQRRVNGDPGVSVVLTESGRAQGRRLGLQLRGMPIDLCWISRFARVSETAALVLEGRGVPLQVDARLDDLGVGAFEGRHADAHREWRRGHGRDEAPPDGESLEAARLRYVQLFDDLLARGEPTSLVIGHELSLRYLLNAAVGSDHLDDPIHHIANATPYIFDEKALAVALDRMRRLCD